MIEFCFPKSSPGVLHLLRLAAETDSYCLTVPVRASRSIFRDERTVISPIKENTFTVKVIQFMLDVIENKSLKINK